MSSPSYFPDGNPGSFVYGNTLARLFGYNSQLQLSSVADTVGNSPSGYVFAAYPDWGSGNNNGNLQSAQTYAGGPGQLSSLTVFNDTYTYDGVNRLTGVYEAGGSNNQLYARYFGYDTYGNMWVTSTAGVPESGMTPNNNVYNSGNNRISGNSYDAAGNQTVVGSYSITYDAENHQTTALDNTTQGQATYVYDGDGRRVQKIIQGGAITTYIYDAENKLAAEYSSAGPPTNPCYTCYLSSDHLGSTRLVTDQNANVIARHDYLPFGEEIPGSLPGRSSTWGAADNVNQKFTGKERDAETGLDYFGARYFSGALGRFASADEPLSDEHAENPQSWNLYTYVRNNPLRSVDPTGKACLDGGSAASCGDYILGGLMAIGNIPSDLVNFPNRVADALISPFTSFRFGDAVSHPFTPSNQDQAEGMKAANVVLLAAPLAEAGAAKIAETSEAVAESFSTATIGPKVGEAGGPGAGKAFPNVVKDAARAESNDTCVFCSHSTTRTAGPEQSNIDHAIPKSRGGNNTLNNAQNTCRTCNLDKGARTTEEYEEHLHRQKRPNDP
ncbi:MAG: HNH endonuclease [Acidobacteriaceae bacterium]|nr:HNH endonuclease [Acidobacteriaceae bacterium]MBV9779935.1 HNH endonuclease [Acidobacteriaceae bacterium]